MAKWITHYICSKCLAHSTLFKFDRCPVCGSIEIREEKLPKNYYTRPFYPDIKMIDYLLRRFGEYNVGLNHVKLGEFLIKLEEVENHLKQGEIPILNPTSRRGFSFIRVVEE